MFQRDIGSPPTIPVIEIQDNQGGALGVKNRLTSWAMVSLLMMSVGCGYTTRGLYNDEIETVSVPIFKIKGLRRDVEFQLTEMVIKAIEAQTPYKVVQSGADTELRGTIQMLNKGSYGLDGYSNPRGGLMNMSLAVTWIDNRTGAVLRERIPDIHPRRQYQLSDRLGSVASNGAAATLHGHVRLYRQHDAGPVVDMIGVYGVREEGVFCP